MEPRGVTTMDDPRLMFWDDFVALGEEHRSANPGAVEQLMAEVDGDEVMTLIYTSGTTGPPKGAMLTHANVRFAVENILNDPKRMPPRKPEGVNGREAHLSAVVPCRGKGLLHLGHGL